jgi:DNA-binding LacI/PurR family transcriptional regulator
MIDNEGGTKAAVDHLLQLGRRRIAVLGVHPGEKVGTAAIRYGAYAEALAEHDVPVPEELAFPAGRWHRSTGAEAMERLLASGAKFDAVLGLNDTLALGAVRVLTRHGIRIPDDVAVVGFDNIDETKYSVPTLTTVDPGRKQIARAAVELLVKRMAGDDSEHQEIVAPYELHVRESTVG